MYKLIIKNLIFLGALTYSLQIMAEPPTTPATNLKSTQDSSGYYPDGRDLLQRCLENVKKMEGKTFNPEDRSWCLGFMQGYESLHLTLTIALASKQLHNRKVSDDKMTEVMNEQQLFCPPESVTLGQMVRTVVKFLQDNPNDLHKPAGVLTTEALIKEFPCHKEE